MDANLELSIVMATYNRADTLPVTLDHLAKQDIDGSRYELIIVDDASPDRTAEVVAELAPQLPFKVRFLRNDDNRGPGYTQNRGIREASAPLLLIMTDDVFMAPSALRQHIDFHRIHPEPYRAALGKVAQSPALRDTALMRNWDPFRFWLLDGVDQLPFYMFWACNVSCKLEFMQQFGMFRDHKGRGGCVAFEDLEVGYRLSNHGMQLHYLPQALGEHYHFYTMEEAEHRWYMRGLNFDEFCRYVPDPLMPVYFHVLNGQTFSEYLGALKGPNPFRGRERYIAWHVVRHLLRMLILNRWTVAALWKPLLKGAEKSKILESLTNRHVYRAYFYYHFLRGVGDASNAFRGSCSD